MINNKELKLFLEDQELGENFNFSRRGRNTSYKINESMFIKLGFKLKKANLENIFVEVNYKKIIENLNNLSIDPLNESYKKDQTFKPSIETTMHAILP